MKLKINNFKFLEQSKLCKCSCNFKYICSCFHTFSYLLPCWRFLILVRSSLWLHNFWVVWNYISPFNISNLLIISISWLFILFEESFKFIHRWGIDSLNGFLHVVNINLVGKRNLFFPPSRTNFLNHHRLRVIVTYCLLHYILAKIGLNFVSEILYDLKCLIVILYSRRFKLVDIACIDGIIQEYELIVIKMNTK